MANAFASGKFAIAECDRCGFRYKLKELRALVIKTKHVNLRVCPTCWDPDHPQLQLGMYPVEDPQALRNPRPDYAGYAQSRDIQWNWNPVGGFDSNLDGQTPDDMLMVGEVGTVTVTTT